MTANSAIQRCHAPAPWAIFLYFPGKAGGEPESTLCIASLTFMGDLRFWSWVHSMKCSAPVPLYSLYKGSRSAGLLGLSGGRAQSGVGIEVSMTLHESDHGTQNGKNGPVH